MNYVDPLIHYAEILRIRRKAARRNSIFLGTLLLIFVVVTILLFRNEFRLHLDFVITSVLLSNFLLVIVSQIWMEMTNKSMLELIEVLRQRP